MHVIRHALARPDRPRRAEARSTDGRFFTDVSRPDRTEFGAPGHRIR